MAGDPRFTRLLLGLGLRTFSMNIANLLAIKDVVLRSHSEQLESDILRLMRNEDPDKSDVLLKKLNSIEYGEQH